MEKFTPEEIDAIQLECAKRRFNRHGDTEVITFKAAEAIKQLKERIAELEAK